MQHLKHSLSALHAGLECNARFYHIVRAPSRGYGSSGPFNWIAVFFSSVPVKDGRRINLSTKLLPTPPHSARWALRSHVSSRRVSISLITLRNTQVMSQLAELLCSCPTDVSPSQARSKPGGRAPFQNGKSIWVCQRHAQKSNQSSCSEKQHAFFFYF